MEQCKYKAAQNTNNKTLISLRPYFLGKLSATKRQVLSFKMADSFARGFSRGSSRGRSRLPLKWQTALPGVFLGVVGEEAGSFKAVNPEDARVAFIPEMNFRHWHGRQGVALKQASFSGHQFIMLL